MESSRSDDQHPRPKMPAAVIPIDASSPRARLLPDEVPSGEPRSGEWLLLEIAQPARPPLPFGILFADAAGALTLRLRDPDSFEDALEDELREQEYDIFAELERDLEAKGRDMGGAALLAWLEDSASHFFRAGDRTAVRYTGPARALVDRLFDEHVLGAGRARVIPFVTHLPLYSLRAAATKFGELMETSLDEAEYRRGDHGKWVRAPERLRLTEDMFVAQVVGRSMEPRIPDGGYCVFRAGVTGSRQGRLVLVEKVDETDLGSRFTVKRYARHGGRDESAGRTEKIRLEPLNPDFEAFELDASDGEGGRFKVIAEFVEVLPGVSGF